MRTKIYLLCASSIDFTWHFSAACSMCFYSDKVTESIILLAIMTSWIQQVMNNLLGPLQQNDSWIIKHVLSLVNAIPGNSCTIVVAIIMLIQRACVCVCACMRTRTVWIWKWCIYMFIVKLHRVLPSVCVCVTSPFVKKIVATGIIASYSSWQLHVVKMVQLAF